MRLVCHTCLKALQSGMLTSCNADPAFTKNGFSNWKNAIKKTESTNRLIRIWRQFSARHVTAPATETGDIGDLLSERHALEKSKKRKILLSTLSVTSDT